VPGGVSKPGAQSAVGVAGGSSVNEMLGRRWAGVGGTAVLRSPAVLASRVAGLHGLTMDVKISSRARARSGWAVRYGERA
jgi:hypothetical protein